MAIHRPPVDRPHVADLEGIGRAGIDIDLVDRPAPDPVVADPHQDVPWIARHPVDHHAEVFIVLLRRPVITQKHGDGTAIGADGHGPADMEFVDIGQAVEASRITLDAVMCDPDQQPLVVGPGDRLHVDVAQDHALRVGGDVVGVENADESRPAGAILLLVKGGHALAIRRDGGVQQGPLSGQRLDGGRCWRGEGRPSHGGDGRDQSRREPLPACDHPDAPFNLGLGCRQARERSSGLRASPG